MKNDALALLSMQLTAAAVEGKEDGPACALLEDLGFTQTGLTNFGSSDPDDCSYVSGKKTVSSGGESITLVAVAIQSYALDSEAKTKGWTQNFTVNGKKGTQTSGEHAAFALAAEKVADDIAALGGTGNVKYWISGQSRGGALAALLAAKLPAKLSGRDAQIFAYTFESPAVTESSAIADPDSYSYIHNYLCSDDLVMMLPPWEMTRYGVFQFNPA